MLYLKAKAMTYNKRSYKYTVCPGPNIHKETLTCKDTFLTRTYCAKSK